MALTCARMASLPAGRMSIAPSASVPSRICRTAFRNLKMLGVRLQLKRPGAPRTVLPFSIAATAKSNAVANPRAPSFSKWRITARGAYYLRIPFLVLSVYGFGYQQGVMDYSRDPEEVEATIMESTLAGVGCAGKDKVLVAHEGESKTRYLRGGDGRGDEGGPPRIAMLRFVGGVGERIVKTAKSHVKVTLAQAVKEATSQMPPEVLEDKQKLYRTLMASEEVCLWTKAQRHMEGLWRFVLIPSDTPNAFVAEILPRRIFITTSFVDLFIESPDELALVLGHEISHLILGHSSERNSLEASFRTVEILLLSLDPTPDGFLSLAFMGLLASVRTALGAVHSRANERSADELGIKLAAMACYDTRAGSQVFNKMHLQNEASGRELAGSRGLFSFFDSHPPSDERFRALLDRSNEENKGKYCRGMANIFWGAIGERGRRHG